MVVGQDEVSRLTQKDFSFSWIRLSSWNEDVIRSEFIFLDLEIYLTFGIFKWAFDEYTNKLVAVFLG
jgi:hypothetical protein